MCGHFNESPTAMKLSLFIAASAILGSVGALLLPVPRHASFLTMKTLTSRNTHLQMANDDGEKKGNFFTNFKDELDSFVDDAINRRLGNGAQYYGKRKSSFYGEDDSKKKVDRKQFDPTEDYRGPSNAGYFKWKVDEETGEVFPVTRLKEKNIEKKIRKRK
mmetsp:Transcript_26467/g.52725  ORF Transcript_26467/g.52725 Transcript_26467/m.52725 type:complete len:161 (-) Transcript_26467:150-632(-)